jgi:hypothetical protein
MEATMKCLSMPLLILFTFVASAAWPQAEPQWKHKIITFDVLGAGTGAYQGTTPQAINPAGAITGYYTDANNVAHGFLRTPHGKFTTFDAPGAGTGSGQGTFPPSMNWEGAITGWYLDGANVYHGFLRAPDGTITTFDCPRAGNGAYQGTGGENINAAGWIAGDCEDASNVDHGLLRAPDGTITTYDAPGAGTGAGQAPFPETFYASTRQGRSREATLTRATWSTASFAILTTPSRRSMVQAQLAPSPEASIRRGRLVILLGRERCHHGLLRAPDGSLTTIDVRGAGTGAYQGTFATNLNPATAITGYYTDAKNVNHGFLRAPDGTITTFEAPGAGKGSGQGTVPYCNNREGAITGWYLDENNLSHGFLWIP